MPELDRLLAAAREGALAPVVLIGGDRVLSEPAAERVAVAAAERAGCTVTVYRRPGDLSRVLEDLRTFSLFEPAKIALVIESALLADAHAAAELLDDAVEALPIRDQETLGERERSAAASLLQVLRLCGLDPATQGAEKLLEALPSAVLEGGSAFRRRRGGRGRTKKQVEGLREGLVPLLEAARRTGIVGWAEGDLARLGEAVEQGLPPGHVLVMAESSVAAHHPVVERLRKLGSYVEVGRITADRQGRMAGLDRVAQELERETGVSIEASALDELARRTLRRAEGSGAAIDVNSAARLAGEYRKLAGLSTGGRIALELVAGAVEDRGEEDVWALLDDLGGGRTAAALSRLRRLLQGADEPIAARLSLFTLLADFAVRMLAAQSMIELGIVPAGERNYRRFEERHAPSLQRELDAGVASPLAGLHPFRLHRIYLAASRLRGRDLSALPAAVLETELRLKGESGEPEAALAALAALVGGGLADPLAAGERVLMRATLSAMPGSDVA